MRQLKNVKQFIAIFFLVSLGGSFSFSDTSLDSERLNLEMRMQTRVEEALSKMLPSGQFVVVVRIEPVAKITRTKESPDSIGGFYLPGVPAVSKFDGSADAINKLTNTLSPDNEIFHKFIRRITVTVVLDKDLSEDVVVKVRDLTRQILGLDAKRGDTLDIQRTAFQKPVAPTTVVLNDHGFSKFQESLKDYWVLISLSLILLCIVVFVLFIFGPLRGFLNRFTQILPTLRPQDEGRSRFQQGESQLLSALMAQTLGMNAPPPAAIGMGPSFSGSLQVENPNKKNTPFSFIREDHLSNLGVLLSRETPEKAAVVLGYLPTEWIIRVLSKMEASIQSEITHHLATTRQLLPEQVEDIEQDLRRRLDYLIGGPDRIIAVYESLDPEAQKRMMDTLKESRPDIADELRQQTFLFEDLEKLDSASLKSILREVDLQTLVLSMKGISDTLKAKVLEHLSEGKAEIVREELELSSGNPGRPTMEAQKKITMLAKRLQKDGQIQIPQIEESGPQARYGAGLRSSLKLPAGLRLKEDNPPLEEGQVIDVDQGIQAKINKFLNRRQADKTRFPDQNDTMREE